MVMSLPEVENVLLVVVDTLRARNLGCYGGSYDVSPTIDELAVDGSVVENAVCTQSGSWISYTTMFRGDHVFGFPLTEPQAYHEATSVESQYKTAYRNTPADQRVPTLLSDGGVETSAIVSGSMLDRSWGWDVGFERYDDDINDRLRHAALKTRPTRFGYRALSRLDRARFPPFGTRRAGTTAAAARDEIARLSGDNPWFFFLQFTDPHSPLSSYDGAPDEWTPYDQEIKRVDDALASVLETLEAEGLRESTLVIVTADHGEALGERGVTGHGKNVYDESIKVPLVFAHPDLPSNRLDEGVARLKDLAPTVLDALGQPPPEPYTGESLLPALTGSGSLPESAFVFATAQQTIAHQAGQHVPPEKCGAVVGIRTADEKYVRAPVVDEEWFFDLVQDRRERRDRSADRPLEWFREELDSRLTDWEQRRETIAAGDAWKVETELEEQLKDLGYM